MARKAKSQLAFQKKLVLNQWLISLFGVKDFQELARILNDELLEVYNEAKENSSFCTGITNHLSNVMEIEEEEIQEFDQNIYRHTQSINKNRQKHEKIQWKYFQYLALLFTEIYFDRYFRNPKKLQEDLNEHVKSYNREKVEADKITPFKEDDLQRIAFFQATGSGKTLQMHINIKQYQHYLRLHKREHKLNHIILLTPNEGLSKQHFEEFEKSGMHGAVLFEKNRRGDIFTKDGIDIIDIHKLAETSGDKTVAVESFEGNNFVLVDEGHRGTSGEKWMKMRKILSKEGFTIEYSATFEQAVATNAGKKLEQQYAKSILFNYSYSYFYKDGYGKDYKILNLDDMKSEDRETKRHLYLTACLLIFYQQMRFFDENPSAIRNFNIEKPLLVLVGGSVNAVRTEGGGEVSDILSYLLFLGNFIKNHEKSVTDIQLILEGKHGMYTEGKDLFSDAFDYLQSTTNNMDIFTDMKRRLFNSEHSLLQIEHLKGSDGEIALQIGDSSPFGIINVGDTPRLTNLCREKSGDTFMVKDREFSESYFRRIDKVDSSVNILMGSNKFTEGWNSWRVSTMGLMNVGISEGSKIIQLFGRGVRLKGKDFNLKRSDKEDRQSPHIRKAETLNIFGIRASYMEQFDKFLTKEGLSDIKRFEDIILPVVCHDVIKKKKLKVLRLKKGMDYKKNAQCPILKSEATYFENHKVVVNWYPKIQAMASYTSDTSSSVKNLEEHCFEEKHLSFLDINQIFFDIDLYKRQHDLSNMILSKERIRELLLSTSLYTIQIPRDKMQFSNDISENILRWQEIATILLKKYVEKFYKFRRAKWEHNYLEYQILEEEDANLLWDKDVNEHQCIVSVANDNKSIVDQIEKLKITIKEGKLKFFRLNSDACALLTSEHLYRPLIHLGKGVDYIKIKPVALNDGEKTFVNDLTNDIEKRNDFFADKEMYLLRNQGRGKGIGFFEEGGFYPDFILWILHESRQYINFIDPHGIRQTGQGDPKLNFHKKINSIENRLREEDPSITLNAFIVSTTQYEKVPWKRYFSGKELDIDDFTKENIFFQDKEALYIKDLIEKILTPRSISTTNNLPDVKV